MFFSVGVMGVMVLAAGLWTGTQYSGNYKEVGADGKGGNTVASNRSTVNEDLNDQ